MKRRALLKELMNFARDQGIEPEITEGANHTKIRIGDRRTVIPRHAEITETTARAIRKQAGKGKP